MKYAHIVSEFRRSTPGQFKNPHSALCWSSSPSGSAGEKFSEEEVSQRIREANARQGFNRGEVDRDTLMISGGPGGAGRGRGSSGVIAVIPIVGVISNRIQMLDSISSGGGTSIQKLTEQFRGALADSTGEGDSF